MRDQRSIGDRFATGAHDGRNIGENAGGGHLEDGDHRLPEHHQEGERCNEFHGLPGPETGDLREGYLAALR